MECLYLFYIISLDVAPFLLIFFVSTVLSKVLLLGPALYQNVQKSKMQQNKRKSYPQQEQRRQHLQHTENQQQTKHHHLIRHRQLN